MTAGSIVHVTESAYKVYMTNVTQYTTGYSVHMQRVILNKHDKGCCLYLLAAIKCAAPKTH